MRPVALALLCAAAIALPMPVRAQTERPVRTFPEFAGAWIIDDAASAGRQTPSVPRRLTITTSPQSITVTKVLQIPDPPPERAAYQYGTNNPPPEVYRLDGTPTIVGERTFEHHYTFMLVADALALTVKTVRLGDRSFTQVTDAYSLADDVLTLHRQLTSVNPEGQIRAMQQPANNVRQTFVYRRDRL